MRTTPEEFQRLDLRAHTLLADVPLHDVWRIALPGGGPGRTILDVRDAVSTDALSDANPIVRALFALRGWLGRLFGWEREPATPRESFASRLTAAEREASLVPTGTPEGPFRVLLVDPREAISEAHNATVHAFSVFALAPDDGGYRLYWAIYVRPVGRLTAWYMRLIDPFRRWVIYPAILRRLRAGWERHVGAADPP